ncbi:IS200/IS605 family transposase [Cytobacillus sp. S13-E01]|uniref:IS200/IS605 family transposase n=1 Tax=Cytobacillus sp. S13-E01 TaxID=3031326 RepID=UPI0023D8C993|nr:IS200/IS605 family transposase [Cytobacillus sp. S13-E01]MDF0728066.1 IS200/IS605 family transposase [Cytobacillus sp. S13-E01]
MSEYNRLNHCKFLIQYHIIWCPKFRFNVLNGNVESELKQILRIISTQYEFEIKEIEIMPDHIHLFILTKPIIAPTDVVRILKSISARELFKNFPKLKEFYNRSGSLWSKGYFASTVGKVSEETVKRYIQEKKSRS